MKLAVFVIAAVLASLAGVAYMLLQSGTVPRSVSADLTITILVMVVLGGVGFRWGAIVGGVLYTLLDQRLTVLAGSDLVAGLPDVLRVPLSEPLFILGVLFILVVMFLPGGIAGTIDTAFRRRRGERARVALQRLDDADAAAEAPVGGARMTWDADLEDGAHTIGRWLVDRAQQSPQRIAIDDRGVTVDYATLAARATRAGRGAAAARDTARATGSRRSRATPATTSSRSSPARSPASRSCRCRGG